MTLPALNEAMSVILWSCGIRELEVLAVNRYTIPLFAALVAIAGGAYWFTAQGRESQRGKAGPMALSETPRVSEDVAPPDRTAVPEGSTDSAPVPTLSRGSASIKEELLTLDVEGMTCEACSGAVKHQMEKLDGVISADVSHRTGKAMVRYDAGKIKNLKAFREDCVSAIQRAGYRLKG
jgi:copper chaperone CopZ